MAVSPQGKSVHDIAEENVVNASEKIKSDNCRAKEHDKSGRIGKPQKIIEKFISGGIDCFGVGGDGNKGHHYGYAGGLNQ
jgi:translation elongation factor EF-Ts